MRLTKYVVVGSVCALLGGLTACATPLPKHDMPASYAVEVPDQGSLSAYMRQQPVDDLQMSGFHLLDRGVDALSARLQLIDMAQTSIDLQYYIYSGDVTGGLIADRLLAAADRGVRVRILLDDIGNSMSDKAVATLDRHTNIELRLFNPVSVRNKWFKLPSKIVEFGRINNRMHNKLMVSDNLAMITGGRNIGDEYYALSELDFQDVDLLGIGPISREASASFDAFWNSPNAIPASVIYANAKQGTLNRMRKGLAFHRDKQAQRPYIQAMEKESFSRDLIEGRLKLYWGHADWLADPPVKADAQSEHNEVPYLARILANHLRDVQSELLIKSAYLIPGDRGVELLGRVVEQGADVSMLTNSLATTDVLAVHSSYAAYRIPMLKKGIRLWELQPMAAKQERPNTFIGESVASLHAKSFVFDRYKLFVGSINLDPRSITLNTEAGVMVYQKDLAIRMADLFQAWTADDYAFELRLGEGDRLQWHAEGRQWNSEPEASRARRFMAWMLNWLPIEDQL
ncbi:phospholipase D family protein [Halopseudomonas pelagia]|uniref:phospholipase D family protein n=1 Tax=Halopseudomonas pelagia TaxID=553151 RepID=UPI0003A38D63|nr:phospholipase D family protein [Halopseudomonas pelagia]|tara:strand:+ start:123994 stop:125535 length:1542 start_codon:yes stop_codon:yes gene_type:complete